MYSRGEVKLWIRYLFIEKTSLVPRGKWIWPMNYTYLSRLRDSVCTGMHAKCFSFFGPLYGPSKGQHTLYCLFNGIAVCLLLLESIDKTQCKIEMGSSSKDGRKKKLELFWYFKKLESLLSTQYTKDHEPRHLNLLYHIHHIYYAMPLGFVSSLFSLSTFTDTNYENRLFSIPSQPEPCMAWGEDEPLCSHIAAPHEPSHEQTIRENTQIQQKSHIRKCAVINILAELHDRQMFWSCQVQNYFRNVFLCGSVLTSKSYINSTLSI